MTRAGRHRRARQKRAQRNNRRGGGGGGGGGRSGPYVRTPTMADNENILEIRRMGRDTSLQNQLWKIQYCCLFWCLCPCLCWCICPAYMHMLAPQWYYIREKDKNPNRFNANKKDPQTFTLSEKPQLRQRGLTDDDITAEIDRFNEISINHFPDRYALIMKCIPSALHMLGNLLIIIAIVEIGVTGDAMGSLPALLIGISLTFISLIVLCFIYSHLQNKVFQCKTLVREIIENEIAEKFQAAGISWIFNYSVFIAPLDNNGDVLPSIIKVVVQ